MIIIIRMTLGVFSFTYRDRVSESNTTVRALPVRSRVTEKIIE